MNPPIIEGIKLTCSDCKNDFRWVPTSTIHPKRCPRCQKLLDFQRKQDSANKIAENKKVLKNAGFYVKKEKIQKEISVSQIKAGIHIPDKAAIEKKLDNAWSVLIKLRAGRKCEVCGSIKNLNSHHVYSRAKKSVRWNPENGVCLCVGHHIGTNFSAHKTPVEFINWLLNHRAKNRMQELEIKAGQSSNLHFFEKELLYKQLLEQIRELKKQLNIV